MGTMTILQVDLPGLMEHLLSISTGKMESRLMINAQKEKTVWNFTVTEAHGMTSAVKTGTTYSARHTNVEYCSTVMHVFVSIHLDSLIVIQY